MKLNVHTNDKDYEVIFGRNILKNICEYFNFENKKALIVTDEGVPSIYIEKLMNKINNSELIILKQGEKTKSVDNYIKILEYLLNNNYSRNDVLIALGGGVIGDLVAFCASTYKRGMNFINIPTTSLSQIDSSIGGKTAINFLNTKNVIGSFYQPNLVLIDFDTLKTLPSRHLYNGLIEALKMGLILDQELYQLFKEEKYLKDIEKVIYLSVKDKIKVIQEDEKEKQYRMILNFGHTLAHPFESIFNLQNIYHGEAVASGMIYMIENLKLKAEVYKIIKNMGINFIDNFDIDQIFTYLQNDKKAFGEKINIIVVSEVGKVKIESIDINALKEKIRGELNGFNDWKNF